MAAVGHDAVSENATSFSVVSGGCAFSLAFEKIPTPRGPELWIRRIRNPSCNLDFPAEAKAVAQIVQNATHSRIRITDVRGIYWGAINEPTAIQSGAAANLERLGGKNISEIEFAKLLQKAAVFQELVDVFRKYNLELSVLDVEEAEALSEKQLRASGISEELLKKHKLGRREVTASAEVIRFALKPLANSGHN
jgi:hypothetical protein